MQGFLTEDTGFLRPDRTSPSPIRQRAAALNRQHIQPRYRKPLHPQQPRLPPPPDRSSWISLLPAWRCKGPGIPPGTSRLSRQTGSSVATAITAGAVAVSSPGDSPREMTQPSPKISVKSILIRGRTKRSSAIPTGKGYGTLNLYQAFLLMRE